MAAEVEAICQLYLTLAGFALVFATTRSPMPTFVAPMTPVAVGVANFVICSGLKAAKSLSANVPDVRVAFVTRATSGGKVSTCI